MFCERMELYLRQKRRTARKALMNPRTASDRLLYYSWLILMKWLEMNQALETDIVLPEIRKKRKVRGVPNEEAISDEELEESDVTGDAELKALKVRVSSIHLLIQFIVTARTSCGPLDPTK